MASCKPHTIRVSHDYKYLWSYVTASAIPKVIPLKLSKLRLFPLVKNQLAIKMTVPRV